MFISLCDVLLRYDACKLAYACISALHNDRPSHTILKSLPWKEVYIAVVCVIVVVYRLLLWYVLQRHGYPALCIAVHACAEVRAVWREAKHVNTNTTIVVSRIMLIYMLPVSVFVFYAPANVISHRHTYRTYYFLCLPAPRHGWIDTSVTHRVSNKLYTVVAAATTKTLFISFCNSKISIHIQRSVHLLCKKKKLFCTFTYIYIYLCILPIIAWVLVLS